MKWIEVRLMKSGYNKNHNRHRHGEQQNQREFPHQMNPAHIQESHRQQEKKRGAARVRKVDIR